MRLLFVFLALLTACAGDGGKATSNDSARVGQMHKPELSPADTTYVPTGIYFLTDSQKGVKMRLRGSDDVYTIAPVAFASVKNIIKTKLEKTAVEKGVYNELCMTFDPKGTSDLKEGTGNPLQPKIAAVVANQLLFVVDNSAKITTGVMCVVLVGYSDAEMKALQNQVEHKR